MHLGKNNWREYYLCFTKWVLLESLSIIHMSRIGLSLDIRLGDTVPDHKILESVTAFGCAKATLAYKYKIFNFTKRQ